MSVLHNVLFKVSKLLSDKTYIKLMYYYHIGNIPKLNNPVTFNEKLQWLKLNDRKTEYIIMADKIKAKEYVASIIGEKHIIPTLQVWKTVDDIELSSLPDRFVLKTNHDSKGVIVCQDKSTFDLGNAKQLLDRHLKTNGYWYGREWPYKYIKPMVFAEEYLENEDRELTDYKVHCFNGEPRVILVCTGRFKDGLLNEDFFSEKWEHLNVTRPGHPMSGKTVKKPKQLSTLLELSKQLSNNIPFLRVDFYIANDNVFFGELTFFPASGFERFVPESYDKLFGDWIKLPKK